MKIFFRLLTFARPYHHFAYEYIIYTFFAVIFGLANFALLIPLLNVLFDQEATVAVTAKPEFSLTIDYVKDIFTYYLGFFINNYGKYAALKFVCAIIFLSVLLSNAFRFLSQKVLTRMRVHVVRSIRTSIFKKITELDLAFFNRNRKGDLMSVLSNDVQEVENSVVSSMQVIFRDPPMVIGFFAVLFSISVKLTLFTLVVLPVSGLVIAYISKSLKKDAASGQLLLGSLLSQLDEAISGIRVMKAFNNQHYFREKFAQVNSSYSKTLKSVVNKRELSSPMAEFLGVTVVTIILLYGGKLVIERDASLNASQFIAFLLLYSQILIPLKNISGAFTNIQRGIAAGERVYKVLDEPVEILEKEQPVTVNGFNSSITFQDACFSYNTEQPALTLDHISLDIQKGTTVALVGPSGAGKSTLADLIPRFYDLQGGQLLIDGVPVSDIRLSDLRKLIGIVTQEPILFNDSVYNNIAFGMEGITPEEVVRAAKIAHAHEFIEQLEEGYETFIGDRGNRLSGGQKQRVSIARAVLKNPPILILDEATSALDTESERLVQDAIINLMQNRTSVVIAHRLSTIQHADQIVVIRKGRIVETGSHEALLEKSGLYRKLYDMQSFN
jgi:subfamily B ATP-binding cassette protein MsbA